MRRIAAFLDIDVPEAIWPELVEEATFEQMRRVGTRLHPTIARVMIGGTDRFFDKGENGRWHGVLAPEDLTAFRERVERRLDPACAKWLERGRGGTDGARP